jgi:hypothetical protein
MEKVWRIVYSSAFSCSYNVLNNLGLLTSQEGM